MFICLITSLGKSLRRLVSDMESGWDGGFVNCLLALDAFLYFLYIIKC